jgi:NADPH-dependent 7-cyano-7-deazaguanine reductase QueF-like protein
LSFAAEDEALKKDLTAVIALQGLPCVQVITVKTQAASDFIATCMDSNKYRVYLNAKGRVVVEKSK